MTYAEFVAQRFTKRHTGPDGLMHAAVGIVGELIELEDADTRENLIEELGDIEFYLQAMRAQLPKGAEEEIPISYGSGVAEMLALSEILLDQAKKWWVYGKEPDYQTMADLVEHMAARLESYYVLVDTTRRVVIEANVAKLMKRYPHGYSDELAIARLDKQ